MKNLWNDAQAKPLLDDPLQARVYSSHLLGQNHDLVLHGGGNTSVKHTIRNLFNEEQSVLYVKGSGWDLVSIEAGGFPAVDLNTLQRLATLDHLSDTDMVRAQRAAMLDPSGPAPSVEAILHAIIPFKFVDHTHADAVVTLSNTANGAERVAKLYGDRVLIVPYTMPGFILARTIFAMTRRVNWTPLQGIVLLNHGVFTFGNDAKTSYERMISLVSEAEDYLQQQGATGIIASEGRAPATPNQDHLLALAALRQKVSRLAGKAMLARLDTGTRAVAFSARPDVAEIATRGPLTPDHVIRTKRIPLIIHDDGQQALNDYANNYQAYFDANTDGNLTCLDPAPRWAVWPKRGLISFGASVMDTQIIQDICQHTTQAIVMAEHLGGWQALPAKDIFELEYWELEQAKLRKPGKPAPFAGQVVLVTGAASGIGRACVEAFHTQGAAVIALDIDPRITEIYSHNSVLGILCDVSNTTQIQSALNKGICRFGGLDVLINNAGVFPPSETIESLLDETWQRSLAVNLTAQQRMLKYCIPFLKQGIDPAVVVIASKNVLAPGPGAAAYSVAKAGATQLHRVAALELASAGIRVNMLHPDAIFDTAIWTKEVLEKRAQHYNMSVTDYKRKNLLKTELTSHDVAALACALAGPLFAKTTGAQIPVDGGNDRVI